MLQLRSPTSTERQIKRLGQGITKHSNYCWKGYYQEEVCKICHVDVEDPSTYCVPPTAKEKKKTLLLKNQGVCV